MPSSDTTHVILRSTSQPSVITQLTGTSADEVGELMMDEPVDLMEQDDESLDSEEDGLRQLLLLQQTK